MYSEKWNIWSAFIRGATSIIKLLPDHERYRRRKSLRFNKTIVLSTGTKIKSFNGLGRIATSAGEVTHKDLLKIAGDFNHALERAVPDKIKSGSTRE